ncbi:hypothetical protein [Bacillus sp. FJAT-45350]|uniref:hypothetical protein n=1 Tax=Bacillus sp. FJAT-45350 TaxID=2011014 RepID=UPI000BB87987|nr:hypothetical protein [Bacillus sp. FJAT-45350]
MGMIQKKTLISYIIITALLIGITTYYLLFFTPKNSLELYQAISFADDFEEGQNIMLEGYEENFKKEDFEYISRLDTTASRVGQFTLIEFSEKTYMVMTTPGTGRLQVLAVEELPKEIRDYFLEETP